MPQIKVNEIDQSVVTRVVSDDKVKILVPIISSFGPGFDGDDTSVSTFTDITDFNRMYGYTDAEFDPIENDYSRNYAAQLIQKGSAVSVVRVNNSGPQAVFDIGPADRTTPSASTVCDAVANSNSIPNRKVTKKINETTAPETTQLQANVVPGSVSVKIGTNTFKDDGEGNIPTSTPSEINYTTGVITWGISVTQADIDYTYIDYISATFCPQIKSIEAKYTGSFGNRLIISISQINTANISQSYQYANISVYYANILSSYDYDPETHTYTDTSVINGVTILETKRVSTNPDDPYYFEDVDFDFIKINGVSSAREELRLIWSNINSSPESGTVPYSGFPVIPLKYNNNGSVFNKWARLEGGADFNYSSDLLQKLRAGFKGYYTADGKWTITDVQNYITEVYGDNGIANSIYTSIANIYKNFTDPYIYDFDFITSGGFTYYLYENSIGGDTTSSKSSEELTIDSGNFEVAAGNVVPGELHINITVTADSSVTASYMDVADSSYTGVIRKAIVNDGNWTVDTTDTNTYGTISYDTGKVVVGSDDTAITVASGSKALASYTYYNGIVPTVSPALPITSGSATYDAYYPEVNLIHTAMRDLVNTRQDCIALFDVPYDYDKDEIVEYSRILNTSYGTIHHPWCWVQHPTIANKQIRMAPSYIFLYTFLSNLIDNVDSQKWFPPAGVKRATARVVKRPDYEIGSVILNKWQNDDTSRVNPIMRLKQYGYVIYGQYTTLQAIDLYTHSALESLNVRLISNVVKKKIFDVCLNMAFEPNTSTLWLKFFSQMDEFLRYMQYNEGVYSYKIKMDESTVTTDDINHLRCPGKVWIAPTRTAEFFDIDFIITEAGAIFPED